MSKWEVMWPEYQAFLKTVGEAINRGIPLRLRKRDSLLADLELWHRIIETSLFFQNPANVEFVVPLAQRRANAIIGELYHRYRPRMQAYDGGSGLGDRLQADDVLRQIDPRLIYWYYLSDIEDLRRDKLRARCPFHAQGQERTPSLNIQGSTGLWYCFGACSQGGSVFQFIQRMESCDFPTALKRAMEIGK